jgi:L-ribulose-5-phosphate 4-epimerase
LVTWTRDNISGDPETGLVVIKPSGVRYEDLKPEHLVVVDLGGNIVEGTLKPSSDTASHLYIYRQRPDVGGVVHTNSPYATFAASASRFGLPRGMADEFGGPSPAADALIGRDWQGRDQVVGTHRQCC